MPKTLLDKLVSQGSILIILMTSKSSYFKFAGNVLLDAGFP